MLSFLLFSTLLLRSALAGITDLNCTESVGGAVKYSQTAVNCQNKLSDATCSVLYTTAVKANTDTDRDAKCAGNPVDPYLVQAAVQLCPQTCGFCCLTPAYACDNKPLPRIPCSSVSTEMCQSMAWKNILEEDCPKTCGLCDSAPGCNLDSGFICQSKNLESFARRYCKKTCGYCHDTMGGIGGSTDCGNDPSCASWIRNGFCTSAYYSQTFKKKFCGRPCGLC